MIVQKFNFSFPKLGNFRVSNFLNNYLEFSSKPQQSGNRLSWALEKWQYFFQNQNFTRYFAKFLAHAFGI
jgi:hypothetical protein